MAEPTFDDIKDQIQFTGFSDAQQQTILGQLERVWDTEAGRDMIEDGLANNGLHYLNVNDQGVISSVAPRVGSTPDQIPGFGNFALPAAGEVYLNGYDALDANGNVQTYSGLHPALDGQTATAKTPIQSLDVDGNVFSVPPIYTMIHETNHAARGEPDIPRSRPAGVYYDNSMPLGTAEEVAQAYAGLNEVSTREILTQMGIDQQRGSYAATSLEGRTPGEAYGLGRDHDMSVTSSRQLDMTGHAAVDAVVLDGITQATLDKFGASSRTDLLDQSFRLGNGNDTVHAFDGHDTVRTGGGNDAVYLGAGDDTTFSGQGNNVIDGGDANLDPTSDHRSDAATDWGFDTVNYTELPAAFSGPTLADGTQVDGVVMSVSADAISVDKGQAFSPMPASDVDTLNNIDQLVGTNRDDVAIVDSLADGTVMDGAGGQDRLDLSNLPDTVTNTPGAGTFNGVAYDGFIELNGAKLYYTDYETIDLPEESAAITAPGPDATVASEQATVELGLDEAIDILRKDGAAAVQEADASTGSQADAVSGLMNGSGAYALMQTLRDSGQETITVDANAMDGAAIDRVGEVLRSATETAQELGRLDDVRAMTAELDQQVSAISDYQSAPEPELVAEDEVSAAF